MKARLKIAFIVRSTLFTVVGGDNLQAVNTAAELKNLGVDVDIIRANEKINYSKYDLLHLFNIIRPADHLKHIKKAKKPVVISSIYLDYSEFDQEGRGGFQSKMLSLLGKNGAEYLKNNIRFIKNQDTLVSPEYLWSHKRAVEKILSQVDLLLPNSNSEFHRLSKDYQFDVPYHVVPNGINTHIFGKIPEVAREEDSVLCVGQVYGLKNQHRLIEATQTLGVKLSIIGKPPPNHKKYYDFCKSMADGSVQFVDFIPQEELLKYYAKSKVHALPSWFETTGLSSLEAGTMGCNLVVGSGGDTQEYFSLKASFCEAKDTQSIIKALVKELNKPNDYIFRDYVLENYSWKRAAEETLTAYKKVLNNEK
jgi:glycosyltransferase involved in cell wall biosynthesis